MTRLVGEIEDCHGQIVLAFLNAGVYFIAERDKFSADVVWRTFEINVGGTVNCLDPVLATMEQRGSGHIALNASLAGYGGIEGSLAYGSTKAALIYMAEALKLTYERAGLTIQIVNPGFVHSEMTAQNDFKMPFIMDADRAAKIICDGFEKGGFEITFPRTLRICSRRCVCCLIRYISHRCGARRNGRGGEGRTRRSRKDDRLLLDRLRCLTIEILGPCAGEACQRVRRPKPGDTGPRLMPLEPHSQLIYISSANYKENRCVPARSIGRSR
jgi:hypothetical protein